MTPQEVNIIDYLLGESDFDGVWFEEGQKLSESRGRYWWRTKLREFYEQSANDKERIAELEVDNAEYEKDTKHLNDLLNSALKEKEELEKEVERLETALANIMRQTI